MSPQKNLSRARPTMYFLIMETIFPAKSGFPALGNTVGPSLVQIQRHVWQIMNVGDRYYEGQLANSNLTTFQILKNLCFDNSLISIKPTHRFGLYPVFVGFIDNLQPLPKISGAIPGKLTEHYAFQPSAIKIGTDPLPQILLYKNQRVQFSFNSNTLPSAMALYNKKTGMLTPLSNMDKKRILPGPNPCLTLEFFDKKAAATCESFYF
jgi:hypothetical protein